MSFRRLCYASPSPSTACILSPFASQAENLLTAAFTLSGALCVSVKKGLAGSSHLMHADLGAQLLAKVVEGHPHLLQRVVRPPLPVDPIREAFNRCNSCLSSQGLVDLHGRPAAVRLCGTFSFRTRIFLLWLKIGGKGCDRAG